MRNLLLVCTTLALSTAAHGQTGDAHQASQKSAQFSRTGQELSSKEIRASIVGNTLTGVQDGEAYTEFLRSDGTISGRAKSGKYFGEWRISGNRICFGYRDDKKNWDCSYVKLRGSQVVWSQKGGASFSTLVRGNPRGL
jgi:hypothetical protein